jgi:hypothetical protein
VLGFRLTLEGRWAKQRVADQADDLGRVDPMAGLSPESLRMASATGSETSTWARDAGEVARLAFHSSSIWRFLTDSRLR